jgi:hypothetical protein
MATAYAMIRNRLDDMRTTIEVQADHLLITEDVKRELSSRGYGADDYVVESVLFPGSAEVSK